MQCAQVILHTSNSTLANDSYATTIRSEIDGDDIMCVWHRATPNSVVFIVYAFVVPVLAFFGFCANFINAIVFMRPKMSPSAFTYLSVLSWLDCASCLIIMLTAFSRSICFDSSFWLVYDFHWQMPLFGFTTGAANLVLACVSLDRLIYLRCWSSNGPPRFCRRRVARHAVGVVLTVSFVLNLPYFFVFVVNDDGSFQVTPYYFSAHYKFHNWFTFLLLAVIPAIFLLVGNAAIVIAFRRWAKQSKKCEGHCNRSPDAGNQRFHHQMKLTVTIIIVISLYLVGELPAHLTSRKSALNLMFGGDLSKVDFEKMAKVEMICITLNALQLSLNIIVYAIINPSFIPEFFLCLRKISDIFYKVFGLNRLSHSWDKHWSHRAARKEARSVGPCEAATKPAKCGSNQPVAVHGKIPKGNIFESSTFETDCTLPPIHLTLGI